MRICDQGDGSDSADDDADVGTDDEGAKSKSGSEDSGAEDGKATRKKRQRHRKKTSPAGDAAMANGTGPAKSADEKDKMQEDAAGVNGGKEAGADGGECMDEDKRGDTGKADLGMKEGGQARHAAEEGEELVWMRTIRGRLMHIARAYAAQIYECHEMLEDEVQPIKIDDPDLRRLVATVQRIR